MQMSVERNCKDTTAFCHPDKYAAREFAQQIIDSIEYFVENMEQLKIGPRWAEDWIQTFAAWMDMEHSQKEK